MFAWGARSQPNSQGQCPVPARLLSAWHPERESQRHRERRASARVQRHARGMALKVTLFLLHHKETHSVASSSTASVYLDGHPALRAWNSSPLRDLSSPFCFLPSKAGQEAETPLPNAPFCGLQPPAHLTGLVRPLGQQLISRTLCARGSCSWQHGGPQGWN